MTQKVNGKTFHPIVWIASYPKSGNTWVRNLLANLFWQRDDGPISPNEIGRKMPGDTRPDMYEQVAGKPVREMTDQEVVETRAGVQKLFTEMGRTHFVKTHSAYCREGDHYHIVPQYTEGAIYVVRDPRDVALSVMNHFGKTAEESVAMLNQRLAALGKDHEDRPWSRLFDWSSHVKTWAVGLGPKCCLLRYEDLHTKPEVVMSQVCKWGGLSFSPKQIRTAIEYSSFDRLKKAESEDGFREASKRADRFFHTGRAERWRTELDTALIAKIEEKHRPLMAELEYELTT